MSRDSPIPDTPHCSLDSRCGLQTVVRHFVPFAVCCLPIEAATTGTMCNVDVVCTRDKKGTVGEHTSFMLSL